MEYFPQKVTKKAADEDQGVVQEMSAEDVVEKLTCAKSVIIVPGYGMVRYLPKNASFVDCIGACG